MYKQRLIELRENEKLTQKTLAEKLKYNTVTYNNWEKGKAEPNIKTLIELADFYNVTLDYICGHKTKRDFEIGYLNEEQQQLLTLIKELNEINTIKAISYISGLIAGQ